MLKIRHLKLAFFIAFIFIQTSGGASLNPLNREAEQDLTATVKSDPIHTFGKFFKNYAMTGTIPHQYTPSAAQIFKLNTFLLNEDEADIVQLPGYSDPKLASHLYVKNGNKTQVRMFVHPLEVETHPEDYHGLAADDFEWSATPTSSTRSLAVLDQNFIAKTSLRYRLAGIRRRITKGAAENAVQLSAYYDDIALKTGGKIPNTNKTWTHFRESVAVGRKDSAGGYTILRSVPLDYAENAYLPYYSLIANRKNGTRWIDELFLASGYPDKLSFFWNEIAKPLNEFHLMVHMDNGIVTMLHQQNALLRVKPQTNKILGVAMRDMNGQSIDYLARTHRLGLSVPSGLTESADEAWGYMYAQMHPMLGYEILKDSNLKRVSEQFLSGSDLNRLVTLSNDLSLKHFNDRYAHLIGPTKNFIDIEKSYKKVYQKVGTPEELKFFASEEKRYANSFTLPQKIKEESVLKFYKIKQKYFEKKTGLEKIISSETSRERLEPILTKIESEARGLVPDAALDHWLFLQHHGNVHFKTQVPLDSTSKETLKKILSKIPETETKLSTEIKTVFQENTISAEKMRSIVNDYQTITANKLLKKGQSLKSAPYFNSESEMAELYHSSHPTWFTFDPVNTREGVALTGLPMNVIRSSDDEWHALKQTGAEYDRLLEKKIHLGSPEFYEDTLKRLRFTKDFIRFTDEISDPVEQEIVKALWIDGFHEFNVKKSLFRSEFKNYAVSPENLKKYTDQFLNKKGNFKLQAQIESLIEKKELRRFIPADDLLFNRDALKRFKPGDFLAAEAEDAHLYTQEKIQEGFRKLSEFADHSLKQQYSSEVHTSCGTQLLNRIVP